MKIRYSFVLLALLSVVLSAGAVFISLRQIAESNHKFCQVMTSMTKNPVPKPKDPKANPSREQNWEIYEEFVGLHGSLGCK